MSEWYEEILERFLLEHGTENSYQENIGALKMLVFMRDNDMVKTPKEITHECH